MKYTERFERDYNWYLSMIDRFDFDGNSEYYNKSGKSIVNFSKYGVNAKESFYIWDSQGAITQTNEPELLKSLLKCKGSCNLHIKMYAEDRASGVLPLLEFKEICKEFNAPEWFYNAVENQKLKYLAATIGNN